MKFWEALKYLEENPDHKIRNDAFMGASWIYKRKDTLYFHNYEDKPEWDGVFETSYIHLDGWEIYPPAHNFEWALELLRAEKPIRRRSWNEGKCLREGMAHLSLQGNDLTIGDLFAEDWVLA